MRQPSLFNPAVSPLRRTIYNVRLSVRNLPTDSYPHKSIMDLVAMHEALLIGDPISLRLAGVTPEMAEEIIRRLQMAARAMVRRDRCRQSNLTSFTMS